MKEGLSVPSAIEEETRGLTLSVVLEEKEKHCCGEEKERRLHWNCAAFITRDFRIRVNMSNTG